MHPRFSLRRNSGKVPKNGHPFGPGSSFMFSGCADEPDAEFLSVELFATTVRTALKGHDAGVPVPPLLGGAATVTDVDRFAAGPNVGETALTAPSAVVMVPGASAGDAVIAGVAHAAMFHLIVGGARAAASVVVAVVVAIVVVVVVVVVEAAVAALVNDDDDVVVVVVLSCLASVDTNTVMLPADAAPIFCRLSVRTVVAFAEGPWGPGLLPLSVTREL